MDIILVSCIEIGFYQRFTLITSNKVIQFLFSHTTALVLKPEAKEV